MNRYLIKTGINRRCWNFHSSATRKELFCWSI